MTTPTQTRSPYIPPSPASPPTTSAATTTPSMPPAQTFDILPPLHDILIRLLSSPSISNAATLQQHETSHTQSQSTQPLTDTESSQGLGALSSQQQQQPPLEIQQLAGEVSSVRARIRRARKAVEALEGGERSVEEQEGEIRALRERIEMQRGMLGRLGGG